MNNGENPFSFWEFVRNEGAKKFTAAVRERIEFAELKTVLKMEIMIEFPVGISSFERYATQETCLMVVPAAMARTIRGLRGSPKATRGAEEWTVDTLRVLRRGAARPLPRIPYWRKGSGLRRPMKSDVPSGEERLTRETKSLLSGILNVRRHSLEGSILDYKSFQSASID